MTKEQEEAIGYVQKQIDYFEKQIKFIEAVDRTYYEAEYKLYKNRVKQFETVLNMLKEKDAEIEQKNTELAEKSAEIEKYKSLYNKALEDLVKADRENIENKKVIDLMAETIRKLAISLASYEGSYNKETINFTGNIKDIKQYFEQKATKNS